MVPSRVLAALLAIALVLAEPTSARAQDARLFSGLEVRGGVLAHDVPGLWAGFRLESGVDINAELLFGRGMVLLGGKIRPAIGATVNTEGYTSKAYVDARWEIDLPHVVRPGRARGRLVGGCLSVLATLLLFVSPTCPVCKTILAIAENVVRSEHRWLRLVLASDGSTT